MCKTAKKLCIVIFVFALTLSLTACGVNITSVGLPTELALDKGATEQLTVSYGTEDEATEEKIAEAAAKLTLEWASSDESVCAVDQNGLVTAIGAGEADVTVSIKDGNLQSVCHVTVQVPLTALTVDENASLVINATDSVELEPKLTPADATDVGLSYESSDEAVATVDANGKVTAVGNGECIITTTATADGAEFKAETAVKVDTAPTGISAEDISMTIGGSATVNAVVEGENITVGSELTYVSKDPAIATVDENGKVSSVAVGSTQITVSNSAGQTTDIAVTVKQVVCAYCGQEGHGSGSCPKKAADEEAARVAAQQQAAAAAAAAGGAGGAAGGAGGAGGSSGGSSGGEHWTDATGRDNYVIIEDGSSPSNANGSGSDVPSL